MKISNAPIYKPEMLCNITGLDYNLPNGELIGGFLALKGNIYEIEKYQGQNLLKKYPYLGPLPLFTVPIGQNLYDQLKNNNGNYIGFNKCSLYYENANCHYSQGCRCYCGHCCRCCTCNHNNINDPNLPLGAVGDKLKEKLKDFSNSFGNYESIDPGNYTINGNKGIYDCFFNDKKGYGYKFQINCEQVPFPKGVVPKNGNVEIFKINENNNSIIKIKPFTSLFEDLIDYTQKQQKHQNKNTKKRNYFKDLEYKPSPEEIQDFLNEIDKENQTSTKAHKKKISKNNKRINLDICEYKPSPEEIQDFLNEIDKENQTSTKAHKKKYQKTIKE